MKKILTFILNILFPIKIEQMEYSWDYKSIGGEHYLAWVNEVPMIAVQTSNLEKAPEELLWLLSIKWREESKGKAGVNYKSLYGVIGRVFWPSISPNNPRKTRNFSGVLFCILIN